MTCSACSRRLYADADAYGPLHRPLCQGCWLAGWPLRDRLPDYSTDTAPDAPRLLDDATDGADGEVV